MRKRHYTAPDRSTVRNLSTAMEPDEATVFRNEQPGVQFFASGVQVGDGTVPPPQVTGVSASSGFRTILVEWDALEDFQTAEGAGGYEVQLDTVGTFDSVGLRTQRTSATLASWEDLVTGTTYHVRVRAIQGTDNVGDWSVSASAVTAMIPTADVSGLDAQLATLTTDLNTAEGEIDTALLQSVESVGVLPALPDAAYPVGKVVFLTTDGKLYRNHADVWVSTVSALDIVGQITETQITDDAITTPKIATGAVTAGEIAAGTITATQIAADTITANEIATDAVTTNELAAGAVVAENIVAGEVSADKLAANSVTAAKLAAITMEVGKYIESDNYDGTDVETGDATQGWRLEPDTAEFNNVKVRGDIETTRLRTGKGPNLILDPGFEAGTQSWVTEDPGTVVARSSLQAHTGTWSLRVTGDGGFAGAEYDVHTPGTNADAFLVDGWVYLALPATQVEVTIKGFDELGVSTGSVSRAISGLPIGSWAHISDYVVGGDGATRPIFIEHLSDTTTNIKFELRVYHPTDPTEVYWDDVEWSYFPLVTGAYRSAADDYAIKVFSNDEIIFSKGQVLNNLPSNEPHIWSQRVDGGASTDHLRMYIRSGDIFVLGGGGQRNSSRIVLSSDSTAGGGTQAADVDVEAATLRVKPPLLGGSGGNLSVTGTSSVTGAATFSSSVAVTGAATFSGDLTAGGEVLASATVPNVPVLLEKRVLGVDSATETFTVPSWVQNISLKWMVWSDVGTDALRLFVMRFNGDSGTNYSNQQFDDGVGAQALATTTLRVGRLNGAVAGHPSAGEVQIYSPDSYPVVAQSGPNMVAHSTYTQASDVVDFRGTGFWQTKAQVSQIELFSINAATKMAAGSVIWLYGSA